MKAEFLTMAMVEPAIQRLMKEHDEFHWAIAWGTLTSLAEKVLSDPAKVRSVTCGLAFSQTDPDFVDAMVGVQGCRVVTKFPGGTYHPKVYGFRSGKRAAAIVGSANFTHGGLEKNLEAAVLITGSTDDQALVDVLSFTAESAKLGTPVTQELADRYRISHKIAARKSQPSRDPMAEVPTVSLQALSSPLAGMDWRQYASAVHHSVYHPVDDSLELLRIAQGWLSAVPSFRDLSTPQRKALAGVIGEKDKTDAQLDRDWGWFGSMRGAGDFKNRISENDRYLARAVDSIPQKGEVTRQHFDRFVRLFGRAFDASQRRGGVATASRLLAMKRPDVFLCVSAPNIDAAAKEMVFPKTHLKLDTYWDQVVEVIRASDWYNADKPDDTDGQLWECRAAMLDAIFYRP